MDKNVQTVLRVEYRILRAPLSLLDHQLVSRLDEHSVIRETFERGLGLLDSTAARYLATGPDHPPVEVTPPPGAAEPLRETEELPADEVDEVEVLAAEFVAEQEAQNLAGELAEDEELRRVQAELRAKHQVEEEHEHGE